MDAKQKKCRTYRFLPAYILLFLAENPLYGSAILGEFRKRLPGYSVDSAVIYRTLQDLEGDGLLRSYWKTQDPGPATKWYEIEAPGYTRLSEYKEEIRQRKANLEFFLKTFDTLEEGGQL